ncbi:uncharacterized protein CTRU02_205872 [Colletotrichum truncatum]|uniref:Uncharacterized protein n=1 Tax=Colletotrichum truncatum TaxID=5467 RepID=A0ACC3Z586_COLTU
MGFEWTSLGRWATGRKHQTPTTPTGRHSPSSTTNLIGPDSATSSPRSHPSSGSATSTQATVSSTNLALKIHTQGIQETLDCVRGGESPESLLALRRLQHDAERRARSKRGEADIVLRALAVIRKVAPGAPRIAQAEDGQYQYKDSGAGKDNEEDEKEVNEDEENEDTVRRWLSSFPSPGSPLGDGRGSSARSMRHVLDAYRRPLTSSNDSYEERRRKSTSIPRPSSALGWYEGDDDETLADGTTAQSKIEKATVEDQKSNSIFREAELLQMHREKQINKHPTNVDYSGRTHLAANAHYLNGSHVSSQTMGHGNTQVNSDYMPFQPPRSHPEPEYPPLQVKAGEDPSPTTADTDIDDILDIYSNSGETQGDAHSSPPPEALVRGVDFPPFFPNTTNAQGPLNVIRAGLSLPPAASYIDIQEKLARNSTIIRYLALHIIPAPDINPIEYVTDLSEPSLESGTRRRGYTRLLQAIRSVYWDSGSINDMLTVVDSLCPPNSTSRRRQGCDLAVFRKIKSADAQLKGCLTATQAHHLDRLGFPLVDVVSMPDLPKVISQGLAGRLLEAAESGALGIARECNLLDEEGALLELLSEPGERPSDKAGKKSRAVGQPSGLRWCVNVDQLPEVGNEERNEEGNSETCSPNMILLSSCRSAEEIQDVWREGTQMTESRLKELETFFLGIGSSVVTSTNYAPEKAALATTASQRPKLARSTGSFRACDDDGCILVNADTMMDPKLQRFFKDIGLAPLDCSPETLENPALHRFVEETTKHQVSFKGGKSWGVNLGGMLHG